METKSKSKKAKAEAPRAYRAVVGLKYPTAEGEKVAAPGEVVSDIPARSVSWLVTGGYIVPADKETD